jgi:hypothetical protein
MGPPALVLVLLAETATPLTTKEVFTAARDWITAVYEEDVVALRKSTAIPFLQKDFLPFKLEMIELCEGKTEIREPQEFDSVVRCMLATDLKDPRELPEALSHLRFIKPRPVAWYEPYRSGVAGRTKNHRFVQTTWIGAWHDAGCDEVYKLTLAIRRNEDGSAGVSMALLDRDLECEE